MTVSFFPLGVRAKGQDLTNNDREIVSALRASLADKIGQ